MDEREIEDADELERRWLARKFNPDDPGKLRRLTWLLYLRRRQQPPKD